MVASGAKVLGPFTVGARSKIGAGAVVLKEVPADCTVVGKPAAWCANGCPVGPDGELICIRDKKAAADVCGREEVCADEKDTACPYRTNGRDSKSGGHEEHPADEVDWIKSTCPTRCTTK